MICENVLQAIGHTPMLRLKKLNKAGNICRGVFEALENMCEEMV